jgi:hypothetical protein
MNRHQTNRQVLTKAIKDLNDFELVVLRERILTICDQALFNKEQIRKDMENSIITPDLYLDTLQSIKDKVDFK